MALSSSNALCHHSLPLSSTKHSLLAAAASHRANPGATTVEPPPLQERRTSCSINIPATLSNLLHLHLARTSDDSATHLRTPTAAPAGSNTPAFSPKEDISSLCQEIHGRGDWSTLLSPLHPWLRREIIKYGELAQATYNAFDFNPFSEFCGSCLYGRHRLLEKLGLARSGYTVSKYVYAMSHVELPRWLERSLHADAWSTDSNWMGYVAVSDDAESRRIGCRDIVVAWRGTVAPTEWFEDIQGKLEPLDGGHSEVKVEHGFLGVYTSKSERTRYNKTSASEQVMAEVRRLVSHYRQQGEEVSLTIAGHSLGGALALLNAYEAASTMPNLPVSVISFGAPRVGNEAFAERLKEMKVKVLRVVVKQDVVPKMPGILFNEGLKRFEGVTGTLEWVYTHAGVELGLDVKASPFLKHGGIDMAGFHNLETYLHLVDGFLSSGREFRSNAKRDVALVNKDSGMLREELQIPPCWSQVANKGMVCNAQGRWVKPTREAEDIPSPYREGAAMRSSPSQASPYREAAMQLQSSPSQAAVLGML
ncbi:phospholipase A1-Igamma1, chloroplastic-like [Canna indica]|uniref:Phospholipase A1-Igamma1, chloroplastic-like n=1 Tax=Canna indica TaxID=4628 RepID=A0AAQ3K008_9LILI|nr:phospholipase A1-Igamma1, chloroplastic-like [Canna indica]